jgi:hypothetical protein
MNVFQEPNEGEGRLTRADPPRRSVGADYYFETTVRVSVDV